MARHKFRCIMQLLSALALTLALLPCARSMYSAGDKVKVLTAKNFNSAILQSDVPAVVEFFAPWCGHCQQLAPTYQRVAENLHGIATVAAVDCDADANKQLCERYEIRGFPTLKVFPGDKSKGGNKTPTDYQGPRSAKGIADATTAGLHARLIQHPKDAAAFEEFRGHSALPKVVLFTDKPKTTALFKSLSMRFRGRLVFAEVRDVKGAIAGMLDVTTSPTLLVLPAKGEPIKYDGKLKAKDLVEFLKPLAGPKGGATADASKPAGTADAKDGSKSGSSSTDKPTANQRAAGKAEADKPKAAKGKQRAAEKAEEVQDPVSAVMDLTADDLPAILEGDDAWLFGVFDGPEGAECDASRANLVQMAAYLGGSAKVGRVNASAIDADTLEDNGIQARPGTTGCAHQLVLKPYGEQSEPDDPFPVFEGDATAKTVQAFVHGGFPEAAVAKLNAASIPTFMAADGGTAPRVLLFTNKDEVPPLFRALAANLGPDSGAVFGAVHEREKEVLEQFKVPKVPYMIVAWVAEMPDKDPQGRPMMGARLQDYKGPLKYEPMAEFLRMVAAIIASATGSEPLSTAAVNMRAPPPPRLNSTADLETLCTQQLGLCAIGVLNPGAAAHSRHLDNLGALQMKEFGKPLRFSWVDATQQPQFLAAFGLTAGDAPTAVVVSPRHGRFAVIQDGLTNPEKVDLLLAKVMAGRQRTTPLWGELELAATGAGVGSKSAAGDRSTEQRGDVPMEADEFDLTDLMSEEIEGASGSQQQRQHGDAIELEL